MPSLPFLIADDHVLFSQAVIAQLSQVQPGRKFHAVSSLAELNACNPEHYALALVDLSFGDGEAFTWLEGGPAIKTLVVTSAQEEAILNKLFTLEVDGCVHKSDEIACLIQGVDIVLAGGRYHSPRIKLLHQGLRRRPDALHKLLSPREYEVLQLVGLGHPNEEIASRLGLRASSISDHKKNLMLKLGVHSAAELMKCAIERGVTRL
jgi:DNA-binding NarL/FixJ family response regulator